MVIERVDNEFIIRIPDTFEADCIQDIVDYLTYIEATSKSKASQDDIDALANEVKKDWWENKEIHT